MSSSHDILEEQAIAIPDRPKERHMLIQPNAGAPSIENKVNVGLIATLLDQPPAKPTKSVFIHWHELAGQHQRLPVEQADRKVGRILHAAIEQPQPPCPAVQAAVSQRTVELEYGFDDATRIKTAR
jgi:hypothetical protein